MGGHAVGELASKMAADSVPHTYQKLKNCPLGEALEQAILESNTAINTRGKENKEFHRMGTTFTSLVLSPEGAVIGHVGDSRLYRIRGGRIDQLTFDHSLQWELLKQGKMSAEEIFLYEPKNVITRCLGPEEVVEVDIEGAHEVIPGDIYLLCSDGLTGLVEDNEIGTIASILPPAEACQLLVHLANLRGGPDNITVVIVRVNAPTNGLSVQDVDPESMESGGISWGWGIALSLLAVTLVIGIPLTLMGLNADLNHLRIPGILILGFAGLQATMMGWAWWRIRRRENEHPAAISTSGGPLSFRIDQCDLPTRGAVSDHRARFAAIGDGGELERQLEGVRSGLSRSEVQFGASAISPRIAYVREGDR